MKELESSTLQLNKTLAFAFGLLAVVVGISASGHPLPIIGLVASVVIFHVFAETHGWLSRVETRTTAGDGAVACAFALFAALFVLLTGGADSPFLCALYLPVLLASLSFGLELGVVISLVMLAICAAITSQGHMPAQGLTLRHMAVGFSFPLVAVFGRLLSQQMEGRYRILHSRAQEMSTLLDMSQMMNAAADLDTTMNLVLLNVQKLTGCPVCAIYLKSATGDRLELRAASGLRDRVDLLPSMPIDHATCGDWLLNEPSLGDNGSVACYIPNISLYPETARGAGLFRLDAHAVSFACLPLSSIEGLVGMLYVGYNHANGMSRDDVERLENFAARAAFSLQRVIVQHDYQSLAYSDAMTGLDNFRCFEQNLNEEHRRAERYDRPMSLILLDIDHFKQFNDTLGHQAGDALLAQLATVLRDSLRSVDKPARYGGEEFVVLCPETGEAEARLIAERIRRNVEQTSFALVDKEKPDDFEVPRMTHVTVSVGYATFPGDARSPRDLIRSADKALYAAKEAGRNAVFGPQDLPLTTAAA